MLITAESREGFGSGPIWNHKEWCSGLVQGWLKFGLIETLSARTLSHPQVQGCLSLVCEHKKLKIHMVTKETFMEVTGSKEKASRLGGPF